MAEGIFKTVNPAFPEEIIDIGKGSTALIPYNAPPEEPRIYLPTEKERYESETGPAIRRVDIFEDREITSARIVRLKGDVKVKTAGSKSWHLPNIDEILNIGDTIVTGDNGQVQISLDNGHMLELLPNTQIIITKLTRDPKTGYCDNEFQCDEGKIIAKVQKIDKNSSFKVKTPTSTCGLRGTIMYLSVSGAFTKAVFEGGDGFMENVISGIKKLVEAGTTSSSYLNGTISDPTQTTDEDRSEFGSELGDEGGTYGYTPPGGGTGEPPTGPGLGDGIPDTGGTGFNQPFSEVNPQRTSGTTPSTNIVMNFNGTFIDDFGGFLGSLLRWESDGNGEANGWAEGTITTTTGPAPWPFALLNANISGAYFDNYYGYNNLFGAVKGEGSDGGGVFGWWTVGGNRESGEENIWNGIMVALYIDSSETAGAMFGDFYGSAIDGEEESGTITGAGDILSIPIMQNIGTSPDDIENYSNFMVGELEMIHQDVIAASSIDNINLAVQAEAIQPDIEGICWQA